MMFTYHTDQIEIDRLIGLERAHARTADSAALATCLIACGADPTDPIDSAAALIEAGFCTNIVAELLDDARAMAGAASWNA